MNQRAARKRTPPNRSRGEKRSPQKSARRSAATAAYSDEQRKQIIECEAELRGHNATAEALMAKLKKVRDDLKVAQQEREACIADLQVAIRGDAGCQSRLPFGDQAAADASRTVKPFATDAPDAPDDET